jgi:deoxyribonucleoside regulator
MCSGVEFLHDRARGTSMTTDSEARASHALHAAQLYYVQERSMDQIADEMAVSRSSVNSTPLHIRSD